MNEAYLQRKIHKDLEQRFPNSKIIKIHGNRYTEKGTPDIIGCLAPSGKTIVIETKIKNNKPTQLQCYRLEQFKQAGAISFWTNSFEDYIEKIKSVVN